MTNIPLQLKWSCNSSQSKTIVEDLKTYLDGRKASLKDNDKNERVLAAIVASRGRSFHFKPSELPKGFKATVKDALACLCGPVLARCAGKDNYEVKAEYLTGWNTGEPIKTVTIGEQKTPPIITKFNNHYTDGSHGEVDFCDIGLLKYSAASLVTIEHPNSHWAMFFDGKPAPSVNWEELNGEDDLEHPAHDNLMNRIVDQGFLMGHQLVRYRGSSFLTINGDACAFMIDQVILRMTGKVGLKCLLTVTDRYGRTSPRWGSFPRS
jgi:hypothetical protein